MAITQVTAPASVPAAIADYQAQNAHISAFNMIVNNQPFILTNSENTSIPAIAIGSYIQFGGNLYIVDTEDYAITGTPVDGNNYIRISGTTTLTAEWIQDISSYVWNPVYGYKYTGSYAILPYLVVKASTEYTKYNDIVVYPSFTNQDVKTTATPTFAGLTVDSNAVMRIDTSEVINPNHSSLNISGIDVGQVRVVTGACTNLPASIKTPSATGTYLVISVAQSSDANVRLLPQNTIIYSSGGSFTIFVLRTS